MSFECDICGKEFLSPLYGIALELQRTIFPSDGKGGPEVDIPFAETIINCCSPDCRDHARHEVLVQNQMEATYPDIGPVETCSRCKGKVDMTREHYMFVEAITDFEWQGDEITDSAEHDIDYVAVLCPDCQPSIPARSGQQPSQIFLDDGRG